LNLENPALWRFDLPPVEPRLASTVLCARTRNHTFEILLLKRPSGSAFASEQYVFPGGKVDPLDLSPEAEALSIFPEPIPSHPPLSPLSPATRKAIYRTALRELAEEVGILVTDQGIAGPCPERFETPQEFYRFLREKGLRLNPAHLVYWVNWVTPKPAPVRFDTHFFLLPLPPDVEPRKSSETVELIWLHPREALVKCSQGEIELMFPTYKSLEQLTNLKTLDELLNFVARFPKLRIEPVVSFSPESGFSIELPDTWPNPDP
jgi:8-oxo-dGTP pyrophosphatase MutT (NUDIX family)